jgi:ribosome biogenesis GTPase A
MSEIEFNHLPLTGWFPGHMLKAGRKMREVIKLVDLVVELVDARAPAASRNPEFRELLPGKPALLVANKADLADPQSSDEWKENFDRKGIASMFLDANHLSSPGPLVSRWRNVAENERRARGATRTLTRPVRVMIVGVPNVGKSTLVNRISAGRKADVGPKPGVTKSNQWITLNDGVELLDTPGVLWPTIRNKTHELVLGLIGSIRDEVLDPELLAEFLWTRLAQVSSLVQWHIYGLETCPQQPHELIEAVARRRGLIRAGGRVDRERAANALLKDFRTARLGRLTVEMPDQDD